MKTAVLEEVVPKVSADSEVPIYDEDNWDFGKEIPSETSIHSSCTTGRSIVQQINEEIKATKEGFLKATLVKESKHNSRGISLTKMTNPHHILKEGYMQKKT